MPRIETYDLDALISSNDIILGTDGDNSNITKNFSVQALKNFVINGLSPIEGGTLKITEIIGDTGENTPQGIINSLDPAYEVAPYEIVIITCDNETKYLFTKNNNTFGVDETQTVLNDFIKIYENFTADGSETKLTQGTSITVTGAGTIANPYIITNSSPNQVVALTQGANVTITGTYPNFTIASSDTVADGSETKINVTAPLTKSGLGTTANPFIIGFNNENYQKTITESYSLVDADNNYLIIIDNNTTPITITVPSGLVSNISVSFVQQGSADVTFVGSGTTINTPIGLKIKGINYHVGIDQVGTSNVYQLLGNTKA